MLDCTFTAAAVRDEFMTLRTLTDKATDGVDTVTTATQHWIT